MQFLPKNIPEEGEMLTTIVHGDYRLDNVIFHPTKAIILSVLDWELSTLGNPFSDLAYLCQTYYLPSPYGFIGSITEDELKEMGIPEEKEVLEKYCERMKISKTKFWNFYIAFSLFRIAGISQGVYHRAIQGNASAPNAMEFGDRAIFLAQIAWDTLQMNPSKL